MSTTTEQIFIEALSLPGKARAALAYRLLESLEEDEENPAIEAAWKREALKRCQAFDEGKIAERNATDVMKDAYRKLQ